MMIHATGCFSAGEWDRVITMTGIERTLKGLVGAACLLAVSYASACSMESDAEAGAQTSPSAAEEYVAPRYVVPEQEASGANASSSGGEIDDAGWRIKQPFYAAGREPYWTLDVEEGWFVFKRTNLPEIESPITAPTQLGATDVFESDSLTVQMTPGACEAAQVGESPLGGATVEFENLSFSGCVYRGKSPDLAAGPRATGWTQEVALRIIEIDACLEALQARQSIDPDTVAITAIYPRETNTIGVVARQSNGRIFECGANSMGEIKFADALDARAAADWMKGPERFLRMSDAPPPEGCLEAEPVESDGAILGYLLNQSCNY
ncbi:MAG: hypothetical protein CME88_15110 [Hirschia sp.]|nr:hypothetical protein [Hirschia sp.]MBF19706.1 hypothetical protein [Hirschia sp.]